MKRAILVVGPESSGTRLATRVLMAAGCAGDDDHVQRWDAGIPDLGLIVWRRSVPHAGAWPDLEAMIGDLRAEGFAVEAVVTTRDWHALCCSQRARGHVATLALARANIQRAYCQIMEGLEVCGVPFVMLSVEALIGRPGAVQAWLAHELGLPEVPAVRIVDCDAPWYGEGAGDGHA